jgi:hypothetical protein
MMDEFPFSSLKQEDRIIFAAAVLRTQGTEVLSNIANIYKLSFVEQKESIRLAGDRLVNNMIKWNVEAQMAYHQPLKELAEMVGIKGDFKTYSKGRGAAIAQSIQTVEIDGLVYVVRIVSHEYATVYSRKKEREHRPEAFVFSLPNEGGYLFLSRFIGSKQVDYLHTGHLDPNKIDYLDFQHLEMLVDLANTFSEDARSCIDFNEGNLVVVEDRLYYVDQDLYHGDSENPRLYNFQEIFCAIHTHLHTDEERALSKHCVSLLIKSKLDLTNPADQLIFNHLFTEHA